MDAPAPWRSLTGEVQTSLPGVTFAGTFPKLARLAHRLAVVRSYSPHDIGTHDPAIRHVFRVGDPAEVAASLGAVITRLHGVTADGDVPPFAELFEEGHRDPGLRSESESMHLWNLPGRLGAASAAFAPSHEQIRQDMQLRLPISRFEDRQTLLRELDRFRYQFDHAAEMDALDEFNQQAVGVLMGGATREALDLSREDPRVLARYDTSHFESGFKIKEKSSLGRRLLLARRLCEAGCAFVTVGMGGWDHHGIEGVVPGIEEGMRAQGPPLDHAVAALLEDLEERGLSDDILLVITGEFGRAPKMEYNGGRDHWPALCPLVFAGGGLKMGQIIGRMARTADVPASEPYGLDHFTSTLMHVMFDLEAMRVHSDAPGELVRMAQSGEPIHSLFS